MSENLLDAAGGVPERPETVGAISASSIGAWKLMDSEHGFTSKVPENYPIGHHIAGLSPEFSQKPLRIVHIGPSFVCAGVESWLGSLQRHLDPKKMQLCGNIVTDSRLVDHAVATNLGVPYFVGGGEELRKAVCESDVLMFWGPPDLVAQLGSTRARLSVFVAHGMGEWTRASLEHNRGIVDHVVAVSEAVSNGVCGGFPTTVIPNGVELEHIAQSIDSQTMRRDLGFDPDDFVVGYVGRLCPEKQIGLIIEAIAKMPRRVKLLCVGWGPSRSALMDACNQLIPGRFAFAEARHHLGDFYRVMDAFCFPSREEGYGLVVAEAMLCGIPVVSTNVGIVPELIKHRLNGVIVDADAISLRQSLNDLYHHPAWRRGMAEEGRLTAEKHCLARRMAEQYQTLLLRLWKTRNSEPIAENGEEL